MKSGIYKITSPTGKIYIGQSVDVEKRIKKYTRLDCISQSKLYRSLLKYGFANHSFEIIELSSVDQLNERERYWQDVFECVEKGLNCRATKSTDKSGYISRQTKSKLSKLNKGLKISKETIQKRKETRSINNKRGYKLNLTVDQRTEKSNRLKKPIVQFSLKGKFIKKWDSALSASIELNISATHIRACCRKSRKSAYGFIWEYFNCLPQSSITSEAGSLYQ